MVGEVVPLEELHDDVRNARVGHAVIEHLHDVRALHLRRRRSLAREALDGLGAPDELRGDELDDDLRVQREVIGEPHRAHPPGAELPHEAKLRSDEHSGGRLDVVHGEK